MAQTDPPIANPPKEDEEENSEDEFHDARFPAEEEAVTSTPPFLIPVSKQASTITNSSEKETPRGIKYLQRPSEQTVCCRRIFRCDIYLRSCPGVLPELPGLRDCSAEEQYLGMLFEATGLEGCC